MIKDTTKIKLDRFIIDNYNTINDIAKKIFISDYNDDIQETILILYSMKNSLLNKLIDNNELIFYIVSIFKNRRYNKKRQNKIKRELFVEDFYLMFDDIGIYGFNYQIDGEEYIKRIDIEEKEVEEFEKILNIIKLRCKKNDGRYFLDKVLKYNDKRMSQFVRINDLNYQNTNNAFIRVLNIVRNELKNKK